MYIYSTVYIELILVLSIHFLILFFLLICFVFFCFLLFRLGLSGAELRALCSAQSVWVGMTVGVGGEGGVGGVFWGGQIQCPGGVEKPISR